MRKTINSRKSDHKDNKWVLLLLLIPIISLIISGAFLLHYFHEYKIADDEYVEIEEKCAPNIAKAIQLVEENQPINPVANAADVNSSNPTSIEAVDFMALLAQNSDVKGWITIPGCNISYPILQGPDNDKYLNLTYQGTTNSAGSIFMDCDNTDNFQDMHTLIYGHNMKNGSMFGRLKLLRDNPAMVSDNPYFYIFTPDGHMRCYRIFATRKVNPDSTAYRLFDGDSEYDKFVQECLSASAMAADDSYSWNTRMPIVTLSTCSGHDARYLVHGVLTAIY